jgi:carbon-monoxide dehydrogenase small subunit
MLVMATALLSRNREPSRAEIVSWMSGNLCRCTGYDAIVTAIERAASFLRTGEQAA